MLKETFIRVYLSIPLKPWKYFFIFTLNREKLSDIYSDFRLSVISTAFLGNVLVLMVNWKGRHIET